MSLRFVSGLLVAAILACDSTAPGPILISDDPGLPAWSSVSSGEFGSCALTVTGEAYCWGMREPAVCSGSNCVVDATPRRVETSVRFTQVAAGSAMRCGVSTTMELYCWGRGASFNGSLGDGVTQQSPTPILVPLPRPAKFVALGYDYACALDDEGTAYCWGHGLYQLGDGVDSLFVRSFKTPTPVATTLKFVSISASLFHTCAVAVSQDAYCWGSAWGTLGIGARDTACTIGGNLNQSCFKAASPQLVVGGLLWKSVTTGNVVSCGVTVDDRGYCWGALMPPTSSAAAIGLLGNGTFDGSKEPMAVAGGLSFRDITAGARQVCGVTLDGDAYCWGSNEHGRLGIGGQIDVRFNTPQKIAGPVRFQSLSAREATCGVSVNKNVFCWGINYGGMLGNGASGAVDSPAPVRVSPPAP